MESINKYIGNVWGARYFWWHLAMSDTRSRFRRSYLGIIWAILTPLLFTLLLTGVMSFIFKSQPLSYAIYVFVGLVVWEVVMSSGNNGCDEFIKAESYIKQFKQPMIIYPIRTTLVSIVYMLFGFIGIVCWQMFIAPSHLLVMALFFIPSTIMLFFVALPVAILCGMANTKFRDFSQILTLTFQAMWYASPIFISADVLLKSKHLYVLVTYNPIYHLLQLYRAPLLTGKAPTEMDFLYVLGAGIVLWLFAIRSLIKNENMLIHYL
ncbi:MAG: ABC transporter permease [Coxiellaceae bacterium]|nr:ABC transporter permease [Coxiellaceae bacterium]